MKQIIFFSNFLVGLRFANPTYNSLIFCIIPGAFYCFIFQASKRRIQILNSKFIMFIFFACPKKTNQQRSGERKDSLTLAATLLVPLRGTSLRSLFKADASESRVAPPSRFSALSFTARLREMATTKTTAPIIFLIMCILIKSTLDILLVIIEY